MEVLSIRALAELFPGLRRVIGTRKSALPEGECLTAGPLPEENAPRAHLVGAISKLRNSTPTARYPYSGPR